MGRLVSQRVGRLREIAKRVRSDCAVGVRPIVYIAEIRGVIVGIGRCGRPLGV